MYYPMNASIVNGPDRAKVLRGFTNTIATISIVIDPAYLFDKSSGIYVNCGQRGLAWERYGMVEQIDPVHGAANEFCAPMGLRIRGAASRNRNYPKHSFRMLFRETYGQKAVDFPFFGDEGASRFRRMDLRTSQNYSWANNPMEGGWLNDLCYKGYELGCDILKFPYHGNWQKHIPALLALSLPRYAILTDSEKNPADIRTLDALKTLDITILRTIDGDVHLFTDGKKVTVR